MLRFLFVGAPGVGKGTYAARAADALKCCTVSSGELLRREVAQRSNVGTQIKSLIESGNFVPDELVVQLVVKHLTTLMDTDKSLRGYILDGFPRSVTQAQQLWQSNEVQIDRVINFTQPKRVILQKLSSRRCCPDCGFVYNEAKIDEAGIRMEPLMPKTAGICDQCGSTKPLITRKDDELSVVKHRLDKYEAIAQPMLQFYAERNVLDEFPVLGGVKSYFPKLLALLNTPRC